jgi:hypothetical protein
MHWLVIGMVNLWQPTVECLKLCPCIVPPGVDWHAARVMAPRARRQAEAIFLGTVVAADTLARDSTWVGADSSPSRRVDVAASTVRYTFSVERSWKGRVRGETSITDYYANTSCGRAYRVGDLYLVYAERDAKGAGNLMTYSCSRVKPEGDLKGDLEILGTGTAVTH